MQYCLFSLHTVIMCADAILAVANATQTNTKKEKILIIFIEVSRKQEATGTVMERLS